MNDFTNIKMAQQPQNLNVSLYPHQLAIIYQMEKLECDNIIAKNNYTKETKLGVNADLVGYGKTLSMIGLIIRDKMEWDLELPFVFESITLEAKGRIKNYHTLRFLKLPTTLILASQTIIGQWEKELSKSKLIFNIIKSKKDVDNIKPENFDVILVTPSMYNRLISTYNNYAWKRFIFDEPGHIKVTGMKEIYANFYWLITATPNAITTLHRQCQGSFMKDIINNRWSPFETIFGDIIIKNNIDFVKASFEMPKTNHFYYECFQPIFNALKNYVSQNIKTMIEAEDIMGAVMSLGGGKTDNIFNFIKSKKEEELIEAESKIQIYTLRKDEKQIKEWNSKKNSILNQINDIDTKFNLMLNDSCPICYDSLNNPVLEYNCQNLFCGQCLFKCLEIKNSCPLCRAEIDNSQLTYININNKTTENNKKNIPMTKTQKIIDIIRNTENGKFLIFSEYNQSFYPISNILAENNIQFSQIKGNVKTREKNLDMYKNGKISVIFLNSNIDAAGLNLQETTDIILFHEMPLLTENQIIGRANRLGRKLELNVHHLK